MLLSSLYIRRTLMHLFLFTTTNTITKQQLTLYFVWIPLLNSKHVCRIHRSSNSIVQKSLEAKKWNIVFWNSMTSKINVCVYIYTVCKSFCMQYECPYISIRFINPSNLPTCTCTCTCNPLPPPRMQCNPVKYQNLYISQYLCLNI